MPIMKNIKYIVILFCLTIQFANAGNSRADSLLNILNDVGEINRIDILNELGSIFSKSDYDECLKYSLEAKGISEKKDYKPGIAKALSNIGDAHFYNGSCTTALSYYMKSIEYYSEIKNKLEVAKVYSMMALANRDIGNHDKSKELLRQSLELFIDLDNDKQVCITLSRLAGIYEDLGEYIDAQRYYEESLSIRKKMNDSNAIANLYVNLGIMYKNMGKYDQALEFQMNALKIHDKLGNKEGSGLAYMNVGVIYKNLESYGKALFNFNKALDIFKSINYKKRTAQALTNLGNTYNNLGIYKKSLQNFEEALEIFKDYNDKNNLGKIYNNLGNLHLNQEEPEKALEYYIQANSIHTELNNKRGIAITSQNIGNIYYGQGQYKPALKYLQSSLDVSIAGNYRDLAMDTYLILSDVYYNTNDFKNSIDLYKKHLEIKDSIFNLESNRRIAEIQYNYLSEKDKRKIELLEKENEFQNAKQNYLIAVSILVLLVAIAAIVLFYIKKTSNKLLLVKNSELEEANSKLKESEKLLKKTNTTKDKFFSIIAHDLKNPIGVFLSTSDFLNKNISNLSKEELSSFIGMLNNSAKNVLDLLENLLEWSRSQTGRMKISPEFVDLSMIAENNISLLEMAAETKNIKLLNEVKSGTMVFADPGMINTVIRNLLSNAIKYTDSKGNISIKAMTSDHFAEVSINDTGIGIEEENISRLFNMEEHFTMKGTENESGTGLGLIICKEFVMKNHGDIWVESKPGKGSNFKFTIPIRSTLS